MRRISPVTRARGPKCGLAPSPRACSERCCPPRSARTARPQRWARSPILTVQIETSWLAFLLVLVFLCVDDWTINVLNLYSGGLSLSNMFERLGRFWTTLIASVFGVALCGVPDVLNFFRYITLFGTMFSPVAGVLVFDYLFVRRMQIDVAALYDPKGRYRYWVGFNPIAVAWTAIGFVICTYAIPTAWIPALLTLLITGVGYLLTVWVMQRAEMRGLA